MTRLRVVAFALFAASCAGPPAALAEEDPAPAPAPAAEEPTELERLRAEEAAARERLAKAEEEVRLAAAKAARARRRAATQSLVEAEAALETALDAGDAAAVAAAEERVSRLAAEVAALTSRLIARPGAPAPASAMIPSRRFAPAEGLPPLRPSEGAPVADGVPSALDWLARHQSPDGRWDADGYETRCKDLKCPGMGGPHYDVGLTGLATLAFLGAGETHKTPKHGESVRNALRWLKDNQDPEGGFGPRTSGHFTYCQAIASLAMTEAYGLTQSPLFKPSAEAGVQFILTAQNPYLGWRYGVRPGDNDTSVTAWMVLALGSARRAGLPVPEESLQSALVWLDKVTEPEYGRAGYTARGNGPARPQELIDRFPVERTESLTAAALAARFVAGQGIDHPMVELGLERLARTPPSWDDAGSIDFIYWFFGTQASFRAGGHSWAGWSKQIDGALRPHQRREHDGCARGSWDPEDPWGRDGGRVYSTAINALTLEMHLRYARAIGVR